MTKDLNDSDSVASANDNPAQDEDFKGSDAEISPESASEADSTKVKKSPKKSPKKKASKKSKKTNKKSPAKKSPAKRKSVTIVEKDPLSNSDDEQAAEDEAGEAEEEYEVEAIVGHREYNAKLVYKIRWKGYGASSDTWEAADSLSCPNLLEAYNFKNKIKTNKRKTETPKKGKSPAKKRKNSDSGNDDDSSVESDKLSVTDAEEDASDYEVEKLVEVRKKRDGTREFLVRWKTWSSKYDTWEPENNLSCPELIEKFMAENVDATKKSTSAKELRAAPKSRKSITFSTQNADKTRSSKRNTTKVTYNEDD